MKVYATWIQHGISFIIEYTLKPICCPLGTTFARYGTIKGETFCRPYREKDFTPLPFTAGTNGLTGDGVSP